MAQETAATPKLPGPPAQANPVEGRFFGKYRGVVVDNKDALNLGRILPQVPAISGMKTNWAKPCSPYSGDQVGFFTIPPIGASVWIEFEGGNPDYPIWSGCFWETGQFPLPPQLSQDDVTNAKVLKTKNAVFYINDLDSDGGVKLEVSNPAVDTTVTMTFTSQGAEINCGASNFKLMPKETDGIKLTVGSTTVTLTGSSIEMSSGKIIAKSTQGEVGITAATDFTASATSNASVSASAKASLSGAQVSASGTTMAEVTAPTTSVKGALSAQLQGASVTIGGLTKFTPA